MQTNLDNDMYSVGVGNTLLKLQTQELHKNMKAYLNIWKLKFCIYKNTPQVESIAKDMPW